MCSCTTVVHCLCSVYLEAILCSLRHVLHLDSSRFLFRSRSSSVHFTERDLHRQLPPSPPLACVTTTIVACGIPRLACRSVPEVRVLTRTSSSQFYSTKSSSEGLFYALGEIRCAAAVGSTSSPSHLAVFPHYSNEASFVPSDVSCLLTDEGDFDPVTSFSSAAPFTSSSRSLGGVQFGDPNPSNLTIWAWPIKVYKEVSPLFCCKIVKLTVSKSTFMWGSSVFLANLLIIFNGFIEIITGTDMHTVSYLSYTKSSHSFRLLVDSPGQSTSLSSYFRERRAVLPCSSFMRNVFPPNTKWRCVSLSTAVLLSCVAVRLGPEDATDVVSTIFRGADWILTSQYKVTKSQVSSIVLSLAPTHSSYASSSLSFYLRGFSIFSLYVLMIVVVRVWLNSFLSCSSNV